MQKIARIMLVMAMLSAATFAFAQEEFYVIKRSKHYHKQDCRLIKGKEAGILSVLSSKEAQQKGLKPCKKCFAKELKDAKASKQVKK